MTAIFHKSFNSSFRFDSHKIYVFSSVIHSFTCIDRQQPLYWLAKDCSFDIFCCLLLKLLLTPFSLVSRLLAVEAALMLSPTSGWARCKHIALTSGHVRMFTIDFAKAFDRANRSVILTSLDTNFQLEPSILRFIQSSSFSVLLEMTWKGRFFSIMVSESQELNFCIFSYYTSDFLFLLALPVGPNIQIF